MSESIMYELLFWDGSSDYKDLDPEEDKGVLIDPDMYERVTSGSTHVIGDTGQMPEDQRVSEAVDRVKTSLRDEGHDLSRDDCVLVVSHFGSSHMGQKYISDEDRRHALKFHLEEPKHVTEVEWEYDF